MNTSPEHVLDARARKERAWLKQTLIAGVISVASGLVGIVGSGWLTERDKRQELDIAASRRAIESVEKITSLIFERDTRAELIASSIRRSAPADELKERKKQYDDVYVRFNSDLQGGLFNIRDRFHSVNYNIFEDILMSSIQNLFISEDKCITAAYDAALRPTSAKLTDGAIGADGRSDVLQSCAKSKSNQAVTFDDIHSSILKCEYTFSDNLFKVVATSQGIEDMVTASKDEIAKACLSPMLASQKPAPQKTASVD